MPPTCFWHARVPLLAGTRRLVHCMCRLPHVLSGTELRDDLPLRATRPTPTLYARGRDSHVRCAATVSSAVHGEESSPSVSTSASARPLVLFNTLSRRKETFSPRVDQGNRVSMYVCGVTVYDYSHIGHARVYVAFDTLYRALRNRGYDVTCVPFSSPSSRACGVGRLTPLPLGT